MPVQSRHNQYRGVNAHLHSAWQATGTWGRFHNVYVAQIMGALKAALLPLGYTAAIEESLQIRHLGNGATRYPCADVLIRDSDPARDRDTASGLKIASVALAELVEDDLEHPYTAVAIYPRDDDDGQPVGWVELLSPTSKGDSRDAYAYLAKRRMVLEQGLVYVEVDLLHETPPTFERLPDYTHGDPDAHPYRIAVIDPRPRYRDAQVWLHAFDVDAPIPAVTIPLNAGDTVACDFGAIYRKTFTDALYGFDMDYATLPAAFDRYQPDDQARILRRMVAVLAHDGELPDMPLAVDDGMSVDEAKRRFEVLRGTSG